MRSSEVVSGRFHENRYHVIRGLLDPSILGVARRHFAREIALGRFTRGDPRVKDRLWQYNGTLSQVLLEDARPRLEEAIGLRLTPTYSFAVRYEGGAVLPIHTDRRACEVSVTVTLANEPGEPWPIYLSREGEQIEVVLEPGDALAYKGGEVGHYRHRLPEGRTNLTLLLHYVEAGGKYAGEAVRERWLGRFYSTPLYSVVIRGLTRLNLSQDRVQRIRQVLQ